jgi:benzoate-CoA ligase
VTGTQNARTIEDLPERFNAAVDLIEPNIREGRADKIAVIDFQGATTYRQLAERIDRTANLLRSMGIHREQRILLSLLDTVDFPTVFLGALKAGIIPVPLNTLLVTDDFYWVLRNSGATAVFVSDEVAAPWEDIARKNPSVQFVSCGDHGPWKKLNDLLANERAIAEAADTHRDEIAFWLYTSGSTGRPKGAMHTHASLRLSANLYGLPIAGYQQSDIVHSVAKQFFAYGLGNALTFPFAAGATVVLNRDRPTPHTVSALLRDYQVTLLNGVPTFFAGWLASDEIPSKDEIPGLRLATSAGECLPAPIGNAFFDRFGIDVIDGLGSTEMLHIFLSQRPGTVRYGCTGQPVPGYELRIVTDDGSIARPGELGELHVKGPTAATGYWKNHPKSLETFTGEWVRTGDKYICDTDGWYTYGGRSDDMLKVGGIFVSPKEVEEALASHDCVLEVAVVGAKDRDSLVKPRAHVVLKSNYTASLETEAILKAHVKKLLAPYKYPRWIEFMNELPKTATGKIQRFKLRGQA